MNSRDRLDTLLDSSVPTTVKITDALTRDMDVAAVSAESQVASERSRSRRTPRLALGFGLAILLTGSAGAAAAAGGFNWLPWAQDPDVAYTFTLPSGRDCEARIVLEKTEPDGDWDAFVTDVSALTVDAHDVARLATEIRNDPRSIVQILGIDGQLVDPSADTLPTDDDWYATANYVALNNTANKLSADAGVDGWWTSNAQVQCEAVTP